MTNGLSAPRRRTTRSRSSGRLKSHLGTFADDRNAVTTSEADMGIAGAAWKAAERPTALLDNADKCV
eukprot:8359188-Alexandrium_andersonii.AAC.1